MFKRNLIVYLRLFSNLISKNENADSFFDTKAVLYGAAFVFRYFVLFSAILIITSTAFFIELKGMYS